MENCGIMLGTNKGSVCPNQCIIGEENCKLLWSSTQILPDCITKKHSLKVVAICDRAILQRKMSVSVSPYHMVGQVGFGLWLGELWLQIAPDSLW
jgi:hypothetical protein